jgi:integrase
VRESPLIRTARAAGRRRGGVFEGLAALSSCRDSLENVVALAPERDFCRQNSEKRGLSLRVSDTLRVQGQCVSGRGGNLLARRRFQKGSLFLRGVRRRVWVARWREDVIEADRVRRVYRSDVIGTLEEFPTRKLAERELQSRLSTVNDLSYRARPTATFVQFASRYEAMVLSQHKPSHQGTVRSHIRKWLIPFFGRLQLREVRSELVQRFLSGVHASPKTVRNLYVTLRSMWKSARAWGYVAHDACDGIVLPKSNRARRFFYSLEEVQRIIAAAEEPYKTFYWLAAETGMRAGELCGLQLDDLDFERRLVSIRQSSWHGKIQSPKTENAHRTFSLSPQLCAHLAEFLRRRRPNELRLLFATSRGTPWDSNLVVKRKLRPLLESLGIRGGGLHGFRHANETLMDRLGVPMKVRQERLGHSDPRLTLGTYTHVASADDARIAAQLGDILHPLCTQVEATMESAAQQPALVH